MKNNTKLVTVSCQVKDLWPASSTHGTVTSEMKCFHAQLMRGSREGGGRESGPPLKSQKYSVF